MLEHADTLELSSPALSNHSSLGALSSSGKMAVRQVKFWLAVMVATVWRRTRTSKQSFSRPCPSRGAPEEVTDVCWQEGWVLFKVLRERLLDFWSHRTSQHSGSWLMSGLNPGVYAKTHCTLYETPVCLSDCVYEKSPRVLARFSQSYEHSFKVIWSLITYQNVGEKVWVISFKGHCFWNI